MTRFRLVTPSRASKRYADLGQAQAFATRSGARFLDRRTGRFVAYPGTELESRDFTR